MPQLVKHKVPEVENPENVILWTTTFEKTCVKPLADAALLGGALLQLSSYFKNSIKSWAIKGLVRCPFYACAWLHLEFQHRSWPNDSKKELDSETLEVLRERNVANVILDDPGQPVTKEEITGHSYVHFHGRNDGIWFCQEKEEKDLRLNRYNYLYEKISSIVLHLLRFEITQIRTSRNLHQDICEGITENSH